MPNKPIIVALDFATESQALELASQLDPKKCRVKVGKELFTRAGPSVVKKLVAQNFDVFLDLKYHDIPNTVANACLAAADLGVWMMNVHAQGGRKMMTAAADILSQQHADLKIIAVTVLTSLDQNDLAEVGLNVTPQEQVLKLAQLAKESGCDGVVCSPLEIKILKENCGQNFGLCTPGIRPANSETGDQKRIMTPRQAIDNGSDWLVIGRPITTQANPLNALQSILDEING